MWTYSQSTGVLTDPTGARIVQGYSGNGHGLNNPAMQDIQNVGPLPRGRYLIGDLQPFHEVLGEDVLPLIPDPQNQMFGRFGFFFHGDNEKMDRSGSDGCPVLARWARLNVNASDDRELEVIA